MDLILALLPIIWLLVALVIIKLPAYKACFVAVIISYVVGYFYFGSHSHILLYASLEGVALALWPILLVITAAIFTYNLLVETGAMDSIKIMLSSVTNDTRILCLLLAWGFGGFMEGMAGFGTAVAIPAAMMVAIGFNPLKSILVCLVANSIPTAFGSVAIPITTLSALTNINVIDLATLVSLQLFLLNTITPFVMIWILTERLSALKDIFFITLASGLALSIPQLLVSTFIGPELGMIISSIVMMSVIIISSKIFKIHNEEYQFSSERKNISLKAGFIAVIPFILIFLLLLFTSKIVPFINKPISAIQSTLHFAQLPLASGEIKVFKHTFMWIATPGVMIFLSAIIGGLIQKASLNTINSVFKNTLYNLRFTFVTIICVVATAKIMTYSGMTYEIAEVLINSTGHFYPFFAPFVGALGGFLTGSGTNSNVLFGLLQIAAAEKLSQGNEFLAMWLASASAAAAGTGKMFSPQSIAIAIGAVLPALELYIEKNKIDRDKAIKLRSEVNASLIMMGIWKYFFVYALIGGLICYIGTVIIN